MSTNPESSDRLDSWKEIAAYVGRDVRTVIRWEQKGGLPVYRIPVGRRQAVYAFKRDIDAWMIGGTPGRAELAAALDIAAVRADWNREAVRAVAPGDLAVAQVPEDQSLLSMLGYITAGLCAIALIVIVGLPLYRWLEPHQVRLEGEIQITDDGAPKDFLVTGGAHLYFTERRAGRDVLSMVPVTGGTVQEISTPFVKAEPQAVRRDGRELLILAAEGEERERALWVLPLPGGNPWRVGSVVCHVASWSPDGTAIAYSSGNDLYVTTDNGRTDHLLHGFTKVPDALRWSQDGKRILIQLRDPGTLNSTFSEVLLNGEEDATEAIVPLQMPVGDYEGLSPLLDSRDDAFVSFDQSITLISRETLPWKSGFLLTRVRAGLDTVGTLTVDATDRRLFGLKGLPEGNELVWFNRDSHQFRPFLPGISARDVDFSRDRRRIVYVRVPENTLWVAASDGTGQRTIPTPGMVNIELPRWSPDGETIAFMGKYASAPHRIYTTLATGGPLHEASIGTDNQGAPTWSPDGKYLVYGRVMCQEEKSCAIEEINLRTGEQTMVPGSEGLGTARWAPNGRFIAALRPDRQQAFLLDRRTRIWRKIADGVNGNDLAWAADSQALYASRPNGDRPEVVRINLFDGKVEPAVDLSDFSKLSGRIDTWFAVTPDNSILFLHIHGGHEIVAFHYSLN